MCSQILILTITQDLLLVLLQVWIVRNNICIHKNIINLDVNNQSMLESKGGIIGQTIAPVFASNYFKLLTNPYIENKKYNPH